jgi:hypothetical protein
MAFDATGGTITTPGDGYKYWTFTAGGTLTVVSSGTVEYLVVAGGGAGGRGVINSSAGGGGAGGLLTGVGLSISSNQTITVGAGRRCNGRWWRSFNISSRYERRLRWRRSGWNDN